MSEYLGLSSRPSLEPAATRAREEFPAPMARLVPCPDCNHNCSKSAEHCPQCGHFFRRYAGGEVTVDKKGWQTIIAGGIVLGWILVGIITAFLVFIVLMLGAGLSVPRR
jgi:hypothetical protein